MCSYISLVTDCPDAKLLKTALAGFGRTSAPMANPSVQRLLGGGERQYCTTDTCDCGTVLGGTEQTPDRDFTKAVQSKTKLGWSKAKIERWLADQRKSDARPEEPRDSYDLWARIIREVLAVPGTSSAGLIVHYYEGVLEEEEFSASRREIALDDNLAGALKETSVDELLVIRQWRRTK